MVQWTPGFEMGFQTITKPKLTYKIVFNMSYNKCPNFISNVSDMCSGFVGNILSNTKTTPLFSKIIYNIVSKHNYKHCFHTSFRIMLCQSARLSKRNLTARKSNFLIGRVVRKKIEMMVHTWSCISTSVLRPPKQNKKHTWSCFPFPFPPTLIVPSLIVPPLSSPLKAGGFTLNTIFKKRLWFFKNAGVVF